MEPWLSFSNASNCDRESLDVWLALPEPESKVERSLDPAVPVAEASPARGSLAVLALLRAAMTSASTLLVAESTDDCGEPLEVLELPLVVG